MQTVRIFMSLSWAELGSSWSVFFFFIYTFVWYYQLCTWIIRYLFIVAWIQKSSPQKISSNDHQQRHTIKKVHCEAVRTTSFRWRQFKNNTDQNEDGKKKHTHTKIEWWEKASKRTNEEKKNKTGRKWIVATLWWSRFLFS